MTTNQILDLITKYLFLIVLVWMAYLQKIHIDWDLRVAQSLEALLERCESEDAKHCPVW